MHTTTRRSIIGTACLLLPAFTIALAQAPKKAASKKGRPQLTKEAPRFKAIWEPVNVPHDLELTSVHFTSADEGWVAGGKNGLNGGVILHTSDGGAHWGIQIGDVESSDRAYTGLQFLSPTLGWATQSSSVGDHRLLRTTDGKAWIPAGTVAGHRGDYRFVSQDLGFVTYGDAILRTRDGGRKWDPVYHCKVRAEIQGLAREMSCHFEKLFFINAKVGFAVSRALSGGAGCVFAKTEDGGTTWTPSVILPGEDAKEGALFFFDQNAGILRIKGKLYRTADGGKTWNPASGAAEGKSAIEFTDPRVGWMMSYQSMTYSTNGGQNWVSRSIAFPAMVEAFSLVQRDRGYAVGEHGMAYRYRVVPIDYTSKGMLAAPAMPAK